MKNLIIYIITLAISTQLLLAGNIVPLDGDPPSYKAPNGKTYTWGKNFDQLSADYSLEELVKMPVWICCGNTSFEQLPKSCRQGIVNSGIKPHQVQNLSPNKTYINRDGKSFTPDADRLRLYGFCMVESDSRGVVQTVDIDAVCDELRQEMIKAGEQPCDDLTPQNVFPDYDRQLIYYTVCGKTMSRPMTDEYRRPAAPTVVKEVVKEVVNCEDDFVNLPVVRICKGESYDWTINGETMTYNEEGTYMSSVPKADNCGKTNTILNLDFYEPIDTTIVPDMRFDFAAGETFAFQSMTLDSAGTYKKQYVDSNGCNANATVVLQEKEMMVQPCTDCVTNAADLGNIEVALRGNYGKMPLSPDGNFINHLRATGGIEIGYWKDHKRKLDLLNGLTCKNSLFEYGIVGGLTSQKLFGGEDSECDCNNASEGSAIHAYIEPGVRWHYLGWCDKSAWLPVPVGGAGLRMHYNDHNLEDISKVTLSPKLFGEARWYFNQMFRSPRVSTVSLDNRESLNSAFASIGVEAFAPGFTFDELNYIGYLKLGYRF